MAEIAVKSVLAVADLPRRDVRFDLIKLTVEFDGAVEIDENGWQAGGHVADPRIGSGQGFFAPSDAEGAAQREDLSADVSLRATQAEDEARGGDRECAGPDGHVCAGAGVFRGHGAAHQGDGRQPGHLPVGSVFSPPPL